MEKLNIQQTKKQSIEEKQTERMKRKEAHKKVIASMKDPTAIRLESKLVKMWEEPEWGEMLYNMRKIKEKIAKSLKDNKEYHFKGVVTLEADGFKNKDAYFSINCLVDGEKPTSTIIDIWTDDCPSYVKGKMTIFMDALAPEEE